MLGYLVPIWGIGALVVIWYRREARRLGIPWNKFIKMSAEEKKKAGARI